MIDLALYRCRIGCFKNLSRRPCQRNTRCFDTSSTFSRPLSLVGIFYILLLIGTNHLQNYQSANQKAQLCSAPKYGHTSHQQAALSPALQPPPVDIFHPASPASPNCIPCTSRSTPFPTTSPSRSSTVSPKRPLSCPRVQPRRPGPASQRRSPPCHGDRPPWPCVPWP